MPNFLNFENSKAWLIWMLAAGFFFFEYFARVAPSVMVPQLMSAFKVTALSLGVLSAYFYYAYISMQIPVGALYDRFGTHRLLTGMATACSLSCFIFASSHTLWMAALGRLVMGFSAAFAFVGALKLAREWFQPYRFGLLAGTTQALGMLGAAMGEGPVSILVAHIDWRPTLEIIGGVLLLLAVAIGIVVRDKPMAQRTLTLSIPSHLWQDFLTVIKNKTTWVNALIVGFLYAPTAAFAELWGPSYLHNVYGINPILAASAVSLIFIGWVIGGPLSGWISDRLRKRKPIILISALASFIFMAGALYLPHLSTSLVSILLFLYGLSNVGVATCYTVACEAVPKGVAGTAAGFANMASVLIGALFQPIIGWLLDFSWDHQLVHGIPLYSIGDYRFAMSALPLCFIISIITWVFLPESYPLNEEARLN